MASLTFELEQFSKGYFLAWIVTTQCWNKVEVTLKVGNTEYLHASKTNRSTGLQVITQSSRDHDSSETPILTISVPESAQLKQSTTSGAINDSGHVRSAMSTTSASRIRMTKTITMYT